MKKTQEQAAPKQLTLELGIEVQKDINGIEMGVLENGIPYLTQRGLAHAAGVSRSVIQTVTKEWEDHYSDTVISKDRISFFKAYLFEKGYYEQSLHFETTLDGVITYTYPDVVCMAFLEYYAFESKADNETALMHYRQFAALGLRKFIYDSLDYSPVDKWKYHHDRVSILKDSSPVGYFTVFTEVTGLIVDLISADVTVNEKTIPDISVGQMWAKHWGANDLESKFGQRIPYAHSYPDYFPQAASNPQQASAYPDAALPEFRRWFKSEYLVTRFPKYILTKANVLPGGKVEALKIGSMYKPLALPDKAKP